MTPNSPEPTVQLVLDTIALYATTETVKGITGRRLRAGLADLDQNVLLQSLDYLVPDWIEQVSVRPAETYVPTLLGLRTSAVASQARSLGNRVLSYIRQRFDEDPDFQEFNWRDMSAAMGANDSEFLLTKLLVDLTQMHSGYQSNESAQPPQCVWRTPRDVERFCAVADFNDLDEPYVRQASHSERTTSMSVREDAEMILIAVATYAIGEDDADQGRHDLTGHGVVHAVEMRFRKRFRRRGSMTQSRSSRAIVSSPYAEPWALPLSSSPAWY